jgi:hypothetical protein
MTEATEVAKLYAMRAETDDDAEVKDAFSVLSNEQKEARRVSKRPSIDHLQDATVTVEGGLVVPLFNIGDKIVAERYCSFLNGNPWLDTKIYLVKGIDDLKGLAKCWDEDSQQNVIIGFNHPSTKVKLCPKKGNPFHDPSNPEKTVRRRRRKVTKKRGRK